LVISVLLFLGPANVLASRSLARVPKILAELEPACNDSKLETACFYRGIVLFHLPAGGAFVASARQVSQALLRHSAIFEGWGCIW
jgi:hypothetical protein